MRLCLLWSPQVLKCRLLLCLPWKDFAQVSLRDNRILLQRSEQYLGGATLWENGAQNPEAPSLKDNLASLYLWANHQDSLYLTESTIRPKGEFMLCIRFARAPGGISRYKSCWYAVSRNIKQSRAVTSL